MGGYFDRIDIIATRFTKLVMQWRYLVVLFCLGMAFYIGSGAQYLEFASNYRVFFSKENPELTAFEQLQTTYTKNDNFLFVLEPSDKGAFSPNTLKAVQQLSEAAWQMSTTGPVTRV